MHRGCVSRLSFGLKKQDNSKLCEFCIYRVSFLTGTPRKVSVYIVNCAEKVLSTRDYLPPDTHQPRIRITLGYASAPDAHYPRMRISPGCASALDAHHPWRIIINSLTIIIFDILESYPFQKYSTCWVFSVLLSLSLSLCASLSLSLSSLMSSSIQWCIIC